MKLYTLYSILLGTLFCAAQSYGQDTLMVSKKNDSLKVTNINTTEVVTENLEILDTLIDGKTYLKSSDELLKPSEVLQDDKVASDYDKKWIEELYNNSLFDTIYRDVTNLKYEVVEYPELSTDTLKARLERLNARTPFNVEYNPGLESVIKSFLKRRHHSLERLMGLSNFYFPMFERELDNYNIPLEMKYLAIVESALKPRAKSRVGATGLWQFMFATGRQYGLDVSSYVDERSDPIKSTESAAKYLARLYEIFDDWDLALAAYNSGPGNVNKAIRRSGGSRNYWNIRPNLPRETAGYVPAFLATMYIFEYAEEHGFVKHKPQFNYVETDTIRVKKTITLGQVSEYTGVDMATLQFLNPAYKLDVIPYIKGKNYTLRLPREYVGTFVNNEDKIYQFVQKELDAREKPLPQLVEVDTKTRYKVRSGDYLGKIARKFGVRVSQIKQWNGLRSNNLKVGQRLTIYPRNPSSVSQASKTTVTSSTAKTYKVKSGDSLWSISQKFPGVSVQNIKDWNGISGNKLKPGMTLKVSKG
ncbi:LysM peptidoglycan-binding domain-containing protein [Bizionia paragorgiae]|uniref:LysM peptidoglycan-binding domain-containing protein n=1 Tax=Bizionia paragorgiae TaxID=283786 RepID=UPI003A8DFE4F